MAMRMNGNNQYLVAKPPKMGKRKMLKTEEIGYTRTTNISKLLEDSNSLVNWRVRVTMLGLASNPKLLDIVRSAAVDPEANREVLDKVAEEAYRDADGWAGADHGTALHAAIEAVLKGEMPVEQLLPNLAPDVLAFLQCMHAYGLQPMSGWMEHMIVHDDVKVAGCFDVILEALVDAITWPKGERRLSDYKTTKEGSIEYAINAYAIQLAIYRNGTPYRQHPEFGGERIEWPENLSMTRGVIVHVPRGRGTCDLYSIDLEAGWEAAQHALWTREWRKRDNLAYRWAPNDELLNPGLTAAVEAAIASAVVTPVPKPIPTLTVVPAEPALTLLEASVAEHPTALADAARPHLTVVEPLPEAPAAVALHEQPHMAIQGLPVRSQRSLSADVLGPRTVVDVTALEAAARAQTFDVPTLEALVPPTPPSAPVAAPAPLSFATVPSAPISRAQAALGGTVTDYVPPRLASLGDLSKVSPADLHALLLKERSIQLGRLKMIAQTGGQAALDIVASLWPVGVPGFGGTYEHSWVELEAMENALYAAEGKLGLPFPDYDQEGGPSRTAMVINATNDPAYPFSPQPEPQPEPVSAPMDYEIIKDTDLTVTDAVVAGLAQSIGALPPDRQQWVAAMIAACASIGYPIGVSSRSVRRCSIVKALIDLAAKCPGPEVRPGEAVMAALAWCGLEVVEQPDELPYAIGRLAHSHAISLQSAARLLGDELWLTRYPNGHVYMEEAPF